MKYWIITNGPQILSLMTGEFTQDILPSGFQVETDLDQSVLLSEYGLYNGELVHVGAKPTAMHKLDADSPVWVIDTAQVEQYRFNLKAKVDSIRQAISFVPIIYQGILFDADETAIKNITAWQLQIVAGVVLPSDFVWRDYNNQDHPADASFVNGLAAAITLRGTELYKAAWAKKAEIDSLAIDDLLSYDVEAGW